MTPKQEAALRLALDCVSTLANARDWVGCTPNERWDEDEMYAELCNATICLKKSLSIIQEALAEQPAQQQKEGFASPGGGYVPAIPRPMPLDWKLVPRKATPEMLKAMDECAQEGYDERLYAGMASSVYMAAWDASPVMGTLPEQPAQQEPVAVMTVLHLKDRTEIGYGPALAGYDLPTGEYKLYTSPPASKPWVGLSTDEIYDMYNEPRSDAEMVEFARAIEAKLREKNA